VLIALSGEACFSSNSFWSQMKNSTPSAPRLAGRIATNGRRIDWNVAGATMSTWHPSRVMTGYAWDAMTAGCLLRAAGPPRSVLMLGFGGGTVARQLAALLPEGRLVGVEMNGPAVKLARNWARNDAHGWRIEIVEADAYAWIRSSGEKFDAILEDIYAAGEDDVFRPRELDAQLLRLIDRRRNADGVLVINLVTGTGHEAFRRRARAAVRECFGGFLRVKPPLGHNEILVCGALTACTPDMTPSAAHLRKPDRETWSALRIRRFVA
jgi:SAM-dependent methyltransferase